jgi:hypothetical protein
MGQAFNLIGNANATTSRTWGVVGGYLASNRAARAARKNQGEGLGYAQSREATALSYLDPYASAGEQALSPLTGLLTGKQYDPDTGEYKQLNDEQRDALMYQSPGYRFAVQQGEQGLARSQAARGLSLSGGAQKELASYLSGAASQYSNDYISQLANLAASGQNAATNQASIVQGNTGALTSLFMGSQRSAYEAQKWQNASQAVQAVQELQAQNHESAGQSLSQMFGGGMGGSGGMSSMAGGMGGGSGGGMGSMLGGVSGGSSPTGAGAAAQQAPVNYNQYRA